MADLISVTDAHEIATESSADFSGSQTTAQKQQSLNPEYVPQTPT